MRRVFLAVDEAGILEASALGHEAICFDGSVAPPPADEYVLCGADAYGCMLDLRGRGIDPLKLSWLEAAKVRDFYWHRHQSIEDRVRSMPPRAGYLVCGITGLKDIMQWRSNELGLIAGPFGQGKSLLALALAQDFAHRHQARVSLTCWEDDAEQIHHGLKRYRDTVMKDEPADIRQAFLGQFRITVVDEELDRRVSDHFDRMEYEAKRYGVKFFVLDPWNEFEHEKGLGQTEADYVINVMTRAAKMTRSLDVIILLTTHVSSEFISIKADEIKPFRINNAFGTSQFGNKVHRGFCVARTTRWGAQSHMIIRHDKAKEEDRWSSGDDGPRCSERRMGRRETLVMRYSSDTNTLYWDKALSLEEYTRGLW